MKRYSNLMAVVGVGLLLCMAGTHAMAEFNTSYTGATPSDGELEDDVTQHEVKVEGSMNVMENEDTGFHLSVGAAFQANVWTFDDDRIKDIEMYKVKVPVGVGFKASERILMNVELAPGIHSDMENVDGDDFRLEGSVVGAYVQSPELQWVLGAAFTEEFGDPVLYPVIGARWQASDALLLNLVFPMPKVTYAVSDDLHLYLAGEPAGGDWNVGKQDEDAGSVDVQVQGFRVGLGGEYQIVDGGWLYAMVGTEAARKIQIGVNDEEVADDDVDLDDSVFVQVGFRLL